MYAGPLSPTTIYGTWADNIEVTSIEDDTLYDFSALTEITLKLKDPSTKFDELILTMTNGDITLPSLGIIQWTCSADRMGALDPNTYEVILLLDDGAEIVPLVLGSIAVVD